MYRLIAPFIFFALIHFPAFSQSLELDQQTSSRDVEYQIVSVRLENSNRTSLSWVKLYLGLRFLPQTVTQEQLKFYKVKLLTTGVFVDVDTKVIPISTDSEQFELVLTLEEKWSLIPVIKADFGGGTPVQTYGVFDTHVLGSLYTVGGLLKKYGDSPMGYSLFIRAPRWLDGSHYLALDFWKNFRIRTLYDDSYNQIDESYQNIQKIRLSFLNAIKVVNIPFQLGFNAFWIDQKPVSLKNNSQIFSQYKHKTFIRQQWLIPTILYDNIKINQVDHDGIRAVLKYGPIFSKDYSTQEFYEAQFIAYKSFIHKYNLTFHILHGAYSGNTIENLYFLGGLDSIRGIPDGAIFGKKAFYSNSEFLTLVSKTRYAWFQTAVFYDIGNASDKMDLLFENLKQAAGLGIRIFVPQITRLSFRFDYAWDLAKPSQNGLSFGLNALIDPYKPLE